MDLADVLGLPSVSYKERRSLPGEPGVYFAVVDGRDVAYVGSSGSLRSRWISHDRRAELLERGEVSIHYRLAESETIGRLEQEGITEFRPPLNKMPAIWGNLDPLVLPVGIQIGGMEDVVLIPEAAKTLGMSRQTLWRHIDRGHLPAKKLGRDYVIRSVDLAAFEAERQKTPGRPRGTTPPAPTSALED